MQRREFVTVAGAALVRRRSGGRAIGGSAGSETTAPQDPGLSPEVFSRRIARAQAELKTRKWDLLVATPGTTYRYFTGYNPGRSERLIALILPAMGDAAIVCPSFEVERIRRHTAIPEVAGWEEQSSPYTVVRRVVSARKPRASGTI